MCALFAKRIQSAYPRSSTNVQSSHVKQRPITGIGKRRSHTDLFEQPGQSNRHQSKIFGIKSTINTQLLGGQLQPDEIESLVRSLDHDDRFIVEVNCLANYRKLVQTINLRQTPIDYKL